MGTVTNIRAQYMVDPAKTRDKIVNAVGYNKGNLQLAARDLECSYRTLYRLINHDEALKSSVEQLKKTLGECGVPQRGWSPK